MMSLVSDVVTRPSRGGDEVLTRLFRGFDEVVTVQTVSVGADCGADWCRLMQTGVGKNS